MTAGGVIADVPAWFAELERVVRGARGSELSRFRPPPGHQRRSAVLMLFGQDGPGAETGPDILLTERATTLRSHAGQVAFPGGAIDDSDAGPQAAALREAYEEAGVDPAGVYVAASLPDLYVPVSDFAVTPVLAWWHTPSLVGVVDPGEVSRVVRVPVAELVDPANRFQVVHSSGYISPGFRASGLFIWGFTAGVLDKVLRLAGWERPWDVERLERVTLGGDPATDERAGGIA